MSRDASSPLAILRRREQHPANFWPHANFLRDLRQWTVSSAEGQLSTQPGASAFSRRIGVRTAAGLVQPGAATVVAYRVWFQAGNSQPSSFDAARFEISESSNLRLANHAYHLAAVIEIGPLLAISALIGFLGIGLLVFWR